MFAAEVYQALDRFGPAVVIWVSCVALWTLAKVALSAAGREVEFSEHMILSELPGLPLELLCSLGWVLALYHRDWASALLLLWWGPGYLIVAGRAVTSGLRPAAWAPVALATSWGCKLSYVVLMAVFAWHGLWALPFAYSVWIMADQVRLAWIKGSADRTRRTFEDLWIPRLLYPGFLLLPFAVQVPGGWAAGALGVAIMIAWLLGLIRVVNAGTFFLQPDPIRSPNLRDIVYLPPVGTDADLVSARGADRLSPSEPASPTQVPQAPRLLPPPPAPSGGSGDRVGAGARVGAQRGAG